MIVFALDNNFNQSNNTKNVLNDTIGDRVEWVLDVTIAYPERIPIHLQDIVCGIRPPCSTHIHYRLYPSTDVSNIFNFLLHFLEKNSTDHQTVPQPVVVPLLNIEIFVLEK